MRFEISPQLPGTGRTRAGHHHGSHTPTSPEAVLLGKMANKSASSVHTALRFNTFQMFFSNYFVGLFEFIEIKF